ncbi:hypothetical protein CR513_36999, partial [Mucuna pruriens]
MASNIQQFGIRGPSQSRMVNEISVASNQRLENQLIELTSLVRQLAVRQHQPTMAAKVCGICTSVEHPTDMCLTLQETDSNNMQFQQKMTATIQDLKMKIGQLADTVSHLQSAESSNLHSQTIPNPRGNVSTATLRSGKELSQPTLQQLPRSAEANSEPDANSQSRQDKIVPVPFPTRTISGRKPKSDEELLKMF